MSEHLSSLRRILQSRRTVLAPVLAGLATLLAVWTVIPQTSGDPVVVASSALPAGAEITASSVEVRTYPPALIPDGAHRKPDDLIGATVGGALAQGAPITDDSLLSGAHAPDGTVLVPVSAADTAAASIIQTGNHVRVYAAGAPDLQGADGKVASSALVPSAVVAGISHPAGGALGEDGVVLTLAVTPEEAAALSSTPPDLLSFAIVE